MLIPLIQNVQAQSAFDMISNSVNNTIADTIQSMNQSTSDKDGSQPYLGGNLAPGSENNTRVQPGR
ncbi:MAG: hypothetical protein M3162_08925 [Thermoproteota archaeon]|nr:hypothetical protein [Thermoproteota archaeon]